MCKHYKYNCHFIFFDEFATAVDLYCAAMGEH